MRTNPNTTSGGFTGTSERRAHPRHRPQPFAYLKVGEYNGGIVMNASEGGLQLAAANSLAPENIARLSLQLSASAEPLEVEARVVWLSESKKTGGFEFVSLTDAARDQIREWLGGDAGKDQFLGPRGGPTRVIGRRTAEARSEARANSANAEIRTPVVSDPTPRGFETMFPPEGEPIPSSPVREVERQKGEPLNDRVPAASTGRDPAPFRANPISERPPIRDQFREREPLRPPLSEARFPARAIFSDSPFQAPASESPRWTNARMGLLTGVVMVICFAGGMIAGRVWMGSVPSGWNLQELIGGASAPTPAAPPPPAAIAPAANPTANPATDADATPDVNGSSATSPPATAPAVTTPAAPEDARASADAGAAPAPATAPTLSSNEASGAANSDSEPLPPELAGNSILVTAPAAGSPSVRVALPQEPLTASASVAIGVRRSAMLPPQPGPVAAHRPERLEFGKIIAQVPDVLSPNIPPMGDPIVILRATIGEQGEIKSIVPIRGRDELIPKAEGLVREWQQFPARLNGQPIESTEEVILTFRTGP